LTVEKINDSYKKLTEALLTVDKRVLISIANSVWTEKDFEVKKAFIDILTQYYNSELQTFDISDPDTPDRINAWIDGKTNHLIKNMIDRLDNNTVMLLINAIYFKGKWASQFDPSKTGQKPFYESGGTVVNVPMMKQEADFKVYEGSGFDVAEFPYGQGNFVMDVIVPHERNGLSSILPSITDPNFSSWIKAMTSKKTDLSMPKFKYGYKKKMKEILSGMGMGIAFYEGADFSNISDRANLCISDVTHQAFIETNEEGTEAAAATVVGIVLTSMPQVFTLNLDHPFVYIIRETTTNSILFMGVVADPSAA
jgi:serpin B